VTRKQPPASSEFAVFLARLVVCTQKLPWEPETQAQQERTAGGGAGWLQAENAEVQRCDAFAHARGTFLLQRTLARHAADRRASRSMLVDRLNCIPQNLECFSSQLTGWKLKLPAIHTPHAGEENCKVQKVVQARGGG
jgi:hypothetical protein